VPITTGALMLMSPFVTQRDPRFFPDPLRFDPERFTAEAKAARQKFTYFPFGGGARQCIGESFAWMEGVLILATLAQRWRFRLEAGTRVEPEALITLRPRNGLPMRAQRR
jgi:cytochrome P450